MNPAGVTKEDITLRNVLFFLCLFVRNALFYSYIRERFKTPRLDCIIGLSVTYNDFVTLYHRAPNANQLDSERKPIGWRTQTDWTANANRLDGGREPIGRRTQTDWTADANGTNLQLFTYNIIVNLLNGDMVAGLQCAF